MSDDTDDDLDEDVMSYEPYDGVCIFDDGWGVWKCVGDNRDLIAITDTEGTAESICNRDELVSIIAELPEIFKQLGPVLGMSTRAHADRKFRALVYKVLKRETGSNYGD